MDSAFIPFPKIFVNRLRRTRPFNMPVLHYHDGYELFYVIEGRRDVFISDTKYQLSKGELLLINPFEMHFSFSAKNPVHDRYVVNVKREQFDTVLNGDEFKEIDNIFKNRIFKLTDEQQKYILHLLSVIDKDSSSNNSFFYKSTIAGIVHLFAFLKTVSVKEVDSSKTNTVLNAVKYINENYTNEITLNEISAFCHLVPSYFCRSFKKITGTTFLQYLSMIRVNRAHILLTTTDKPIFSIAEECGFSSVAHMTRLFNKSYGLPPSRMNRGKF